MPLINHRILVSLRSKHANFNFAIDKSKTLGDLKQQILQRDEKKSEISEIYFRTS